MGGEEEEKKIKPALKEYLLSHSYSVEEFNYIENY
jgi:hypothetical protein